MQYIYIPCTKAGIITGEPISAKVISKIARKVGMNANALREQVTKYADRPYYQGRGFRIYSHEILK